MPHARCTLIAQLPMLTLVCARQMYFSSVWFYGTSSYLCERWLGHPHPEAVVVKPVSAKYPGERGEGVISSRRTMREWGNRKRERGYRKFMG